MVIGPLKCNSGVDITIPVFWSIMDVNFENNGFGVRPDFKVIPTTAKILTEKGVALEFIPQNLISNSKKKVF